MVRVYQRKTVKGYTPEALRDALNKIERGSITIRKASKSYGIPFETLRGRTAYVMKDTPGRCTALKPEEERQIAETIATFSEYGHPLGRPVLTRLVANYIKSVGRETSFIDGVPGTDWVSFNVVYLTTYLPTYLSTVYLSTYLCLYIFTYLTLPYLIPTYLPIIIQIMNFERRQKHILTRRRCEILTTSRANSMTERVRENFFIMWRQVIEENNLDKEPFRVFNCDESGMDTCRIPVNG